MIEKRKPLAQKLPSLLDDFRTISITEIEQVQLMKRVETKFVLPLAQLMQMLPDITKGYKVLQTAQNRLSTYHNLYFDTPCLQFYHDHHRGKQRRNKVRIRTYVDENQSYLEVKQKNPKGFTQKQRMPIETSTYKLNAATNPFLEKAIGEKRELHPVLTAQFKRITLADHQLTERCTIDIDIQYDHDVQLGKKQVVIIEVKQASYSRSSPLMRCLKQANVQPYKVSKYCLGMALTRPSLKQNLWKQKFRKINKTVAANGNF